jgi:hypothetical protein
MKISSDTPRPDYAQVARPASRALSVPDGQPWARSDAHSRDFSTRSAPSMKAQQLDRAAFGGRGGVAVWSEIHARAGTVLARWRDHPNEDGTYVDPSAVPPLTATLITGTTNDVHIQVDQGAMSRYAVLRCAPDGSGLRITIDGRSILPSDSRQRLDGALELIRIADGIRP